MYYSDINASARLGGKTTTKNAGIRIMLLLLFCHSNLCYTCIANELSTTYFYWSAILIAANMTFLINLFIYYCIPNMLCLLQYIKMF